MEKILTWRLIDSPGASAAVNMATDEALLDAFDEKLSRPTLRLYTWKPASVSIGYFQDANKTLAIPFLIQNRIPFVRRPTGGGVIFHDAELTYSLVIPKRILPQYRDIPASYKYISSFLLATYASAGLRASFAFDEPVKNKTAFAQSVFCFAGREKYDILINGKKIGGNAQRRTEKLILQHGSIPIRLDLKRALLCINKDTQSAPRQPLKIGATSLADELGQTITIDQLKNLMLQSCEKSFGAKLTPGVLTDLEVETARRLYEDKYNLDEWNLNRKSSGLAAGGNYSRADE